MNIINKIESNDASFWYDGIKNAVLESILSQYNWHLIAKIYIDSFEKLLKVSK